jgi:hypothetical protein
MLADLRTGDYVEVRGVPNAGGNGLAATLLERERPEARSYLQGMVTSVANQSFTILGVTVATDAQTQFLGLSGQSSAPADFYANAQGQSVKVRGALTGNVFLAEQVQIRN